MAIALVAHSYFTSTTATTTSISAPAINATGATLLVAMLACLNNPPSTVTDSAGNTWTALVNQVDSVTNGCLYYCQAPTVSASLVITGNFQSVPYAAIAVAAFSGTDSNSFQAQSGNAQSSVTTIQPGSITPVFNGCLFFVGDTSANAGSALASISAGTILDNSNGTPGNSVPIGDAYYIQSTAAAFNPTLTFNTSVGQGIAVMACFAPAGSVSGHPSGFFFGT